MFKKLSTLYFVLSAVFTYSQNQNCDYTISGTTMAEHHPEPLSYAIIQVIEADTTISSDDEGHYILQNLCEGRYTLICSFLGFETDTQIVYVNKNVGVFFNLHPTDCQLDEVEVKVVNNQDDIIPPEESIVSDGISVIKELSGAGLLQTGANTVKPVNHGLHSSRLRVVQAGASIENQQWGEEHGLELSGVRDYTLSDQNNLIYNHDGIGGVLNAEPRILANNDSVLKTSGLFHSSMNSNTQSIKLGGEVETNLRFAPWLGVKVFGSSSLGADTRTPEYSLNNTGYANSDYGIMFDIKRDHLKSTLFYSYVHQDLGIFAGSHIGNLTDFQKAIEAKTPDEDYINSSDYLIEGPKQEVAHELLSYKLKIYGKYEVQISRQFNLRKEFEGHAGEEPEVDLQLNLTTWNGDFRYYFNNNNWKSTVGANSMNQTNTWDYREFIPNYEFNRIGGYFLSKNDSISGGEYTVEIGLRYDYYNNQFYKLDGNVNRIYHNLAYSLNGVRQLNSDYQVSLINGMSWRPPSANELFSEGVHHGAAIIEEGDENLLEEVSNLTQLELNKTKGKMRIDANIYGNLIRNFIYSQPSGEVVLTVKGAFPKYNFVQTDALFYGSDFKMNFRLTDRLSTVTQYTLIRTIDFSTDKPLIGVTPNRIEQGFSFQSKHFGKYNGQFERHNWKLSVDAKYYFEKKNTNLELEFAAPPRSFLLLNTVLTYQIKNKRDYNAVNIRFGVYNLLNTRYRDYMNRYRFFANEMGRNFKLSIEMPLTIINKNKKK